MFGKWRSEKLELASPKAAAPSRPTENVCSTIESFGLEIHWSLSGKAGIAGVSGKGFLALGNRKGNWKSHSRFTGREREFANCYGKGNLRLVIPGIPGNPGNHIKSKIKFKIIFMPWQAIRSQSFFNQCKDDICNSFTRSVIPQVYQTIGLPLSSTMSNKTWVFAGVDSLIIYFNGCQ